MTICDTSGDYSCAYLDDCEAGETDSVRLLAAKVKQAM